MAGKMVPRSGFTAWNLAILSTLLSLCYAQVLPADIRLFGGSGSYEGRVEVRVNGQWGTVCNVMWDIVDANVVCREFNRTVVRSNVMYGEGTGPVWYSAVKCRGREERLQDCPVESTSVDTCKHTQDAGVQCGVKLDDLRLVGGSTPNEGRVEVYRGEWGRVCAGSSWDKQEADVVCKTIGYLNGAAESSGSFGSGNGSAFLANLTCTGSEKTIHECRATFTTLQACPSDERDATVVCLSTPEVITEQLSTGAIAGIGVGFGLVIVICCIFSLNCKCRPCWKKRELDDTDVYQCNTGSNADSKVYSTTSNLKSESQVESRNDSIQDIDPNMFVFAPKVPPAGFGAPSNASGTNGMLPNIAEEPNGRLPVSEDKAGSEGNHHAGSMAAEERSIDSDGASYCKIIHVDEEDKKERENVTIDPQGGAHFKKDNPEEEDDRLYLEIKENDYHEIRSRSPLQNEGAEEDKSENELGSDPDYLEIKENDYIELLADSDAIQNTGLIEDQLPSPGAEMAFNVDAFDTRL